MFPGDPGFKTGWMELAFTARVSSTERQIPVLRSGTEEVSQQVLARCSAPDPSCSFQIVRRAGASETHEPGNLHHHLASRPR